MTTQTAPRQLKLGDAYRVVEEALGKTGWELSPAQTADLRHRLAVWLYYDQPSDTLRRLVEAQR